MLIDWFTVAAQALNFLVLVWLLRRFLYGPILKAIDAREKHIADELADASKKQTEAKTEREDFQKKNDEFDKQRAQLFSKVTDEADAEKKRLLAEARKSADAMSAKRLEALNTEVKNLNQAITQRTQDEVFSIVKKILAELADTGLEKSVTDVFIRQLREMDGDAKSDLADALSSSTEPAILRSAFDLPDEERTKIQTAINEIFSAEVKLKYETSPDLVSGIELTASGKKVAWSISNYLNSLEKGIADLIKAKAKPEPSPAEKPETKSKPEPAQP